MPEQSIEFLIERFSKNPAAHIPRSNRLSMRSKTFREKYVDISFSEAESLQEPENFCRLFGLGDSAHLISRDYNRKLITKLHNYAQAFDHMHNRITEKNLGLVYKMISGIHYPGKLDEKDIESEGLFALVRAVNHFNPWRGFKFSTYACNVIVRAICKNVKSQFKRRARFPSFIEAKNTFDSPSSESDLSSDNTEFLLEEIPRVLAIPRILEQVDIEILRMRYCEDKTLKQVGRKIKYSKERVRQRERVALNELRLILSSK